MTLFREARTEDLGSVIELILLAHCETDYRLFALDAGDVDAFVSTLLEFEDGYVGVAERDGELVGVLMGLAQKWWFGPDVVAFDVLFYVVPEARSGVLVKRMLEKFESWAKDRGAVRVVVGISSGVAVDRKDRLLGHLGFKAIGGLYAKDSV